MLSELTRGGTLKDGSAAFPCDVVAKAIYTSPDFVMLLLPMQTMVTAVGEPASKIQRTHMQTDAGSASRQPQQNRKGGNGKRNAIQKAPIPNTLPGCVASRGDGQPICFSFNIKSQGCTTCQPGDRCRKGWHVCAKETSPGVACGKPHPQHEHA
eukprot:6473200-Amphidinium_carterae.1